MPVRTTITRRARDGSRRNVQALEVVATMSTSGGNATASQSLWIDGDQQLYGHQGAARSGGQQLAQAFPQYEVARLAQEFGQQCSLVIEVRATSEVSYAYEVYPPGRWPMLTVDLEAITGP